MTSCTYYDCGYCYAPKNVKSNNKNGACYQPQECPQMIKKPEFPKPRLIREDFLPVQTFDMIQNKYRIKKVGDRFYVQILGFVRWHNIKPLGWPYFSTYDEANRCLYNYLNEIVENKVEYFEPDFSKFKRTDPPRNP
jgi:hypothetical protein